MTTSNDAIDYLNKTLQALESSLEGKTAAINNAYREAEKAANKAQKEAIALAQKTKEDALEEFKNEKAEILKLKNAIKALGGGSVTKEKTVKTRNNDVQLVKTFADAKNNKEKIYFILHEIKSGTNDDIIKGLLKYDPAINGKTINLVISDLKGDGVIGTNGKVGKKYVYIPA